MHGKKSFHNKTSTSKACFARHHKIDIKPRYGWLQSVRAMLTYASRVMDFFSGEFFTLPCIVFPQEYFLAQEEAPWVAEDTTPTDPFSTLGSSTSTYCMPKLSEAFSVCSRPDVSIPAIVVVVPAEYSNFENRSGACGAIWNPR